MPSTPSWVQERTEGTLRRVRDLMHACSLRRGTTHQSLLEQVARDTSACHAHPLEPLWHKPPVAEAILTAPCAREWCKQFGLSLGALVSNLRPELHAAAARGYFGTDATEWCLNIDNDSAARMNLRAVRLLAQQSTNHDQCCNSTTFARLASGLARAPQLDALVVTGPPRTHTGCSPWLCQLLAPLSSLRSLEVSGFQLYGATLPDLKPVMAQLRSLTSLTLEGAVSRRERGLNAKAQDVHGTAVFVPTLAGLTALRRLSLSGFQLEGAGADALGRILRSMSFLTCVDLRGTSALQGSHAVAVGLAACPHLTELDLSRCGVGSHSAGAKELRHMCATRMQKLALEGNRELNCAGAAAILAAPGLYSLTFLNLSDAGLRYIGSAGTWPWRQVCALTALRELWMHDNVIGDGGAAALAPHISALEQLRRLSISAWGIYDARVLADELFSLPRLKVLACEQRSFMLAPFRLTDQARARGLKLVPCADFISS